MKLNLPYLTHTYLRIMPYYAVARGHKPGIYATWFECKAQTDKYSRPIFRKFSSKSEAEDFIREKSGRTQVNCGNSKPSEISATKYLTALSNKQATLLQAVSSLQNLKRNASTSSERTGSNKRKKIALTDVPKKTLDTVKVTSDGFMVDDDGYTHVYTDGACSSNGKRNARAGLGVWFGDDHPLNLSRTVTTRVTNNAAEIEAVTEAAMIAKRAGVKKLKINTDSQFLISCITQWMPKWKRNGWMTGSQKPVINKAELLKMEEALSSIQVYWNHVDAHVGIHGNEMADQLAREGCTQRD